MSQWVFTSTGDAMPIQTPRPLTDAEYNNKSMKDRMNLFDKIIKLKLGDSMEIPKGSDDDHDKYPEQEIDNE